MRPIHTDSLSIIGKPVGDRATAEVRSGLRGAGAGGPGHVHRPTLAGHRFRLTRVAPSTASVRALVAATANGACARAPSHLPWHLGGMRRRGTPRRMQQGGGAAPGRRPDSRSLRMVAGHYGNDAAADCSLRRPPASVGRRTGAPPPPCRHNVGRLTVRGQDAVGRRPPQASRSSSPESRPEVERPASRRSRLAGPGQEGTFSSVSTNVRIYRNPDRRLKALNDRNVP
jgi:hypothetical protein